MSKTQDFFGRSAFLVVGASTNREKFGNKVLRALKITFVDGESRVPEYKGKTAPVVPINPKETVVEGLSGHTSLKEAAEVLSSMSIKPEEAGIHLITPPKATKDVVKEALSLGFKSFWMQPGAEENEAIEAADSAGALVISGGPCVLVELSCLDLH
uniref:CoA-binding domain-containing protein n=1 Tax=Chromera velia CCMP2878 TaxID=1169474 RepID=A0A0G4IAL0_9ALVE|eukprot:Cvel_2134.t1-p1 / transcript=Cvel_2134.t1 / gene=Cvel_2134 / organism=Chromera_velia_CCMP2878 / gene_product=hypothetical protein / transcript_product=hypothetical protein / location=Cvel_scaffold82:130733-133650(+) / protein_length=155 / sequence_SO=supercontig / SO=protein_coding / is_pseudo=false